MQTLVVTVILQKWAPNRNTDTTNRIQSFAYPRHPVEALGLHLVWPLSCSPPQWFRSASTITFNSRQETQNYLCICVHCFYQNKWWASKIIAKSARPIKQLKKVIEQRNYSQMAEKKVRSNQPIKNINYLDSCNFTALNFTFSNSFSIGNQSKREDSRISSFRR